MNKCFKFIYISPLSVLLFVLFYLNNNINLLLITYGIMLIHELCHLLAALFIGLLPKRIEILPFGICLKLKNKIVRSLSDEIILYIAGPLANILMALFSKIFFARFTYTNFFYLSNIALFTTNILPIVPLDGGMILKKLLAYKLGEKKASKILKITSTFICFWLIIGAVYLIITKKAGYSLMVLSLTAFANIFTQSEKYDTDCLHELMFYKNKKRAYKNRARILIHENDKDLREVITKFSPNNYSIVCVTDQSNRITQWLTEDYILDSYCK